MNEGNAAEDRLRVEIGELKRQLEEQKRFAGVRQPAKTSPVTLVMLGLILVALIVVGYLAGAGPRQRRESVLADESKAAGESLPSVTVARVTRLGARRDLTLPGGVQALTEAPVLARATGYIKRRLVDIGDRVTEGQALAEIEAPELDQQILQATAALEQANSASQQTEAALKQGQTNEALARANAARWKNLLDKGVVSRLENDTYQAQWASQQANVEALGKAVAASHSNMGVLQAALDRLKQLKTYQTVRAPFAGVITLRNVDTGALANEGSTLLFRIAQTDRLRTFISLPQSEAELVHVGDPAVLTFSELPGREFTGKVTRTSNSLDPSTRTLLTEVEIPNPGRVLMPGMYARVTLSIERTGAPLAIRGDTLVVRADGPQVAVVDNGGRVHFTRIQLGRDYGDRIEALSGLEEGQQVVVNPNDSVREGVKVKPALLEEKPAGKKS